MNCSDWTLRLSQSSLVPPFNSAQYRENTSSHVDQYMKERSYDLGTLHKYASNRVSLNYSIIIELLY